MLKLYKKVRKFLTSKEEGATMVEYGMMVALIAAVCVGVVQLLGTEINTAFNDVYQKVK